MTFHRTSSFEQEQGKDIQKKELLDNEAENIMQSGRN